MNASISIPAVVLESDLAMIASMRGKCNDSLIEINGIKYEACKLQLLGFTGSVVPDNLQYYSGSLHFLSPPSPEATPVSFTTIL